MSLSSVLTEGLGYNVALVVTLGLGVGATPLPPSAGTPVSTTFATAAHVMGVATTTNTTRKSMASHSASFKTVGGS